MYVFFSQFFKYACIYFLYKYFKSHFSCDPGFKEPHCVPKEPLPCELRDTFDLTSSNSTLWPEVYGGEISARCGVLVSGTALVFYKVRAFLSFYHLLRCHVLNIG